MSKKDRAEFPQEPGNYEVGYCKPPVATRFQPGNRANPGGNYKRTPRLSNAYERMLMLSPEERNSYQPRNGAEEIALAQIKKAVAGEVKHAAEIANRIEGKAMQSVSVTNQTEVEKARARFEAAIEGIISETGCSYEEAVEALIRVNPENQQFLDNEGMQ